MRTTLRPAALALVTLLLAACTSGASPTPIASAAPSGEPSSPAAGASAEESASAAACAKESLATTTAGQLTIGTDNPAYPPYFDPPAEGEAATEPWELGDPTNGRGFESAVAYAIANQLGFGHTQFSGSLLEKSFLPGLKVKLFSDHLRHFHHFPPAKITFIHHIIHHVTEKINRKLCLKQRSSLGREDRAST